MSLHIKRLSLLTLLGLSYLALLACSSKAEVDESAKVVEKKPPNFLVMIGDDMSTETIGCYKVGSDPAKTPSLDGLCNDGMRFDNFWAQPVCSPTRATILTGQYGFRNGVGAPADSPTTEYPRPDKLASAPEEDGGRRGGGNNAAGGGNGGGMAMGMGMGMGRPADTGAAATATATASEAARPGLYAGAYGLPTALTADSSKNYQTAAVGKWHLADDDNGGLNHPSLVGFEHHSGNLNGGGVESFYSWSKVIDGNHTPGETDYATSVTVDDALKWLGNKNEDNPWLLWVAFNAPHSPWGAPPEPLLSSATVKKMNDNESTLTHYQAMIEAMDTEIGRLLKGIDPAELDNTYIIFMGDNGTPNQGVTAPNERNKAKGTLYQGGINVPFMVSGPDIDSGTTTAALANSVDLYNTILDLAGTAANQKLDSLIQDSVSLAPVLASKDAAVRDFAYADVFGTFQNTERNYRAIRNDRFKILRNVKDDSNEFYDLQKDPYEKVDLMANDLSAEQQSNFDGLLAKLNDLVSSNARVKSE